MKTREQQLEQMIDFLEDHPDARLIAGRKLATACQTLGLHVECSPLMDDDDHTLFAFKPLALTIPKPPFCCNTESNKTPCTNHYFTQGYHLNPA